MVFTYDLTTDIGKVRLLCRDNDASAEIFSDAEIQAYLDMEGSVKLAAAQALDDIASDQVLILQVMSSGDYSINGAAMAKELRARAEELRRQAMVGDGAETFDIAEINWEDLV